MAVKCGTENCTNGLKTSDEMPYCVRCPYVKTGYRPIPCSPLYCMKSVFFPTNETLNFWTHFIPFLIMLWRLLRVIYQADDPYDSVHYVFYVHTIGNCYVYLVSSLAHMFCSISECFHRICYVFDYTAIYLYGITCHIAFERFLCPIRCFGIVKGFATDHYMWLLVFICPIQVYMMCSTQNPSYINNFALLRDIPFALEFVFGNFPCVVRFILDDVVADFSDDKCFELAASSGSLLLLQFVLCVGASAVFTFHIPEIFLPGYFDIFGHSHQWFHILGSLGMYTHNFLAETAMIEAKTKIKQGLLNADYFAISWNNTFGYFLIIFCVSNVITALYSIVVIKRHYYCKQKKF